MKKWFKKKLCKSDKSFISCVLCNLIRSLQKCLSQLVVIQRWRIILFLLKFISSLVEVRLITLGRESEKIVSLWIPKQSRLWLPPTCPLPSPGVMFSKTSFISWMITYRIYSISLLIWFWELFLFNGRDESQLTACPFVQIEFVGACNSLLGQKKTQEEKERYS